jgi:hypothetical protein
MPNPLFQTLSTASRVFCDLHMAPARFGRAADVIPKLTQKLHPRDYKTSAVTPELAVTTSRQSSNSFGLLFGWCSDSQDAPVFTQHCSTTI